MRLGQQYSFLPLKCHSGIPHNQTVVIGGGRKYKPTLKCTYSMPMFHTLFTKLKLCESVSCIRLLHGQLLTGTFSHESQALNRLSSLNVVRIICYQSHSLVILIVCVKKISDYRPNILCVSGTIQINQQRRKIF